MSGRVSRELRQTAAAWRVTAASPRYCVHSATMLPTSVPLLLLVLLLLLLLVPLLLAMLESIVEMSKGTRHSIASHNSSV
jgi:hypothetical protein